MAETGDRRFTERQASEILRRATVAADTSSSGLSLADIEQIGKEIGLDADAVRQAAGEFQENEAGGQAKWLGAPPSYELERILELPLNSESWPAIVAELNRAFGQKVEGEVSGTSFSWQWKHAFGFVHVVATPCGDRTRIGLTAHIDNGLTWVLIGSVFASLVAIAATLDGLKLPAWASVLIAAGILLGAGLGLRASCASWFRSDQRKMKKLMNRLVEVGATGPRASISVPRSAHAEEAPDRVRLET